MAYGQMLTGSSVVEVIVMILGRDSHWPSKYTLEPFDVSVNPTHYECENLISSACFFLIELYRLDGSSCLSMKLIQQ